MASVYDEINRIKRQGSEYDNKMSTPALSGSDDTDISTYDDYLISRHQRAPGKLAPINPFMSGRYSGYGKSQYDKGLTFMDDLVSNPRSLSQVRYDNQP
jgi:hypothetical protein